MTMRVPAALVLAALLAPSACSTGGKELTADEYALLACREWRQYAESFSQGQADTSLVPLAQDDASLAAEKDGRYAELRAGITAVETSLDGRSPVDMEQVAAVSAACERLVF